VARQTCSAAEAAHFAVPAFRNDPLNHATHHQTWPLRTSLVSVPLPPVVVVAEHPLEQAPTVRQQPPMLQVQQAALVTLVTLPLSAQEPR
jgi:hypothetical protein